MRENRLLKGWKSLVVICLALVMTLGYAIPTGVSFAADQKPFGSEGVVNYEHEGLQGDQKRVSEYTGTLYAAQKADPSIYEPEKYQYVYCINQNRNASGKAKWNMDFRWRWNTTANRWLLDNSARNLTNPEDSRGSGAYDDLVKIMYVGFPYNGTGKEYNYDDTQRAVFKTFQGSYSGFIGDEATANEIIQKASEIDISTISATMYMYLADSDAKQVAQDTIGLKVWSTTPPTPQPSGLSAKVGFKGVKKVSGVDFSNDESVNQFAFRLYWGNGKDDGKYHTRIIPKDTSEENPGEIIFDEMTFVEKDEEIDEDHGVFGPGKHTFYLRELNPSENLVDKYSKIDGMIYDDTVYEIELEAKVEDGKINVYYGDKNVAGKVLGEDGEFSWNNKLGKLNTTVSCNGSTASSDAPATVLVPEGGATKDVVDKIDYENLVGGATYKVQGTLMDVTDASNPKEVKKSDPKDCVADKSGKGTWDITFEDVKLEPGKTYVVYESAQITKGADGSTITDGDTIKHEDPEDKSQTLVAKLTNIKLSTKVENQYISPAANQSFTDTVTFEGLEEGKTYTIKGVVKNQKDESDVAAECEPAEVTSSINQHGMQFRGIDASKFNDGDKLVVFEYLYEGTIEETKDFTPGDENDVARHEDLTDVAQTVTIVDGQIKLEKTTAATSVKPGDVVPYTITVTNERKVPATVQIVDNPETGLKYVEASDGGVYDSDVNTVVWDGLEVPANGSVSVDVFFSITEDASGKVTNRAHVFEPGNPENVLGAYEDASDVKVLGAYDDNTDNGSNKKSKGANTGDDAPLGIAMIVLLAAAGGFEIIRRRRTN